MRFVAGDALVAGDAHPGGDDAPAELVGVAVAEELVDARGGCEPGPGPDHDRDADGGEVLRAFVAVELTLSRGLAGDPEADEYGQVGGHVGNVVRRVAEQRYEPDRTAIASSTAPVAPARWR